MKIQKIGIISSNINTPDLNIGAILHSYAFQKYLNSFDKIDSEIIDYILKKNEKMNFKFPFLSYIKNRKFKSAIISFFNIYSRWCKFAKLKNFIDTNTKISRNKYTLSNLSTAHLDYDTVVCESDIIWSLNATYNGVFDSALFLDLPSMKNIKKVAYAPSLGNMGFDSQKIIEFKKMIKDFSAISCRETYGVNFVQNLTSLNVEHVLDPVFLLDANEYKKIMSNRLIKKKYVLLYIAGKYSKQSLKLVKQFAKNYNLKFVEISKFTYHKLFNKTFDACGVEEFLSLIYYADVVFSDSFHCTAFSIIFNKDFYVLNRHGQDMKILDLCHLLNLDDRICAHISALKNNITHINYKIVNEKISNYTTKSKKFIINNIVKDN